jgi:hypothetical protein
MTIDDQKEQFSFAYARAVAAVAKVAVSEPAVDDDSVDLEFKLKGGGGAFRSPQLGAQVKCTETANVHQDHIAYALKLKNYEELRPTNLLVPRILIVVTVPDDLNDWLNHSEQEEQVGRAQAGQRPVQRPAHRQQEQSHPALRCHPRQLSCGIHRLTDKK